MTKPEARRLIDSLNLPAAQAEAAQRTIGRATRSEAIDIIKLDSGELLVRRSRPGRNGRHVFEDTIRPDGSKHLVQMAYDADGNPVHDDPKGGIP